MNTNCTLADLDVGCTVRSHRRAPSAWVIERIENGRAYMRNLYDVRRAESLPLAASIWAVTFPTCAVD